MLGGYLLGRRNGSKYSHKAIN